jgi:hypothetical protein
LLPNQTGGAVGNGAVAARKTAMREGDRLSRRMTRTAD